MEYAEYKSIYDRLNNMKDVKKLIGEGYDERLIETIYTQKTSRDIKKRYYIVKGKSRKLLNEWKKGTSMLELAERWNFSPILMAMIIFAEDGASKKEFWEYINDPDILSEEVADELREVIENDIIYSPEGNRRQRERGLWGEDLLHQWLDGQGITYRTESDLRDEFEKTPDALLDRPAMYRGEKIYWVESKASFGDNTEFRYNSKKQLIPYTELFGPGIVVYWTGCLNDLECPEGVFVRDISILDERLDTLNEADDGCSSE